GRRSYRPRSEELESRALLSLSPGAPPPPPAVLPFTPFTATGLTNATSTLNNFKASLGGGAANTATAPQSGGFRTITWHGVKLDGTDFGGGANTTVISPGTTVGIPLNRFQ